MLFNDLSIKKENLPNTIPVFPLSGTVLLPGIELPLNIFEKKYINMVDDAFSEKKLIGMIQPEQKIFSKLIKNKPLYKVGCVGRIKTFNETDDGRYLIVLSGITRFETEEEIPTTRGYRRFKVKYNNFSSDCEIKKLRENFKLDVPRNDLIKKIDSYLKGYENYNGLADVETLKNVESAFLVDFLCSYLPFSSQEKQLFVESKTIEDRAKTLYKVLGIAEADSKLLTHNHTMH